MQNYGYGSTYQADNDRKRTLDYEDQGNGEYGVSKGKRQKAETGKKKVNSTNAQDYTRATLTPRQSSFMVFPGFPASSGRMGSAERETTVPFCMNRGALYFLLGVI